MSAQARSIEGAAGRAAGVVALLAAAAFLGKEAAAGAALPGLAIGALVVGFLVLQRQLWVLVPLTTAALVVGSSSLPFAQSPWMLPTKFGLMGAVAGTALTSLLDRRREHRVPMGFAVAFLGLGGLALLSTLYSVAPGATVQHAGSLLILGLAAAVAVPLGCERAEDFMRVLRNVGYVAALAVLVGMLLSAANVVGGFQIGRFQGLLGNPNTLGYFIAPILPVLVLMAAHQNRPRRLLIVTAAVLIVGLVLSGSRAGLVSALFATVVGLAVARNARRALIVSLTFGVVIAGMFVVWDRPVRPVGEGVLEIATGGKRLEAWPDGLRLIAERPFAGYGFAATPVVFPELRSADIFRGYSSNFGRLHNSYLEAAMDLGWPGALLMTLLGLSGLWAAWRVSRTGDDWRPVGAMLIAGIAGGMMEGVFESGLLAAGGLLAFHFWILVAAAHALRLRARNPASALR